MNNQSDSNPDFKLILPGGTIGMVGGGQLGRMFAIAATQMGYQVVVFCETEQEPAAQIAHRCVFGRLNNMDAVEAFANQCDVITLEFENIPEATIAKCQQYAPTYPSSDVLATAQDRLREKNTIQDAGLPVAPFCRVVDAATLATAAEAVGLPLILKTARSGYDGKGQHRITTLADADHVAWSMCDEWVAEQLISFDREVSVVVARTADGRTSTFPIFENDHVNHILDVTMLPATLSDSVQKQAREIAITAAKALDVVGLLCVEMFVRPSADGSEEVIINEVAPRPHNSGHLTIEACHTSQFEQHVRAVCGLPLGNTEMICGGAAMANLLGDVWGDETKTPPWDNALAVDGVKLHLYGKVHAKPGRKMGHLTCVGNDRDAVVAKVREARSRLTR
ncbi:5-(carboxyamino)imidazole ribonucleotide synthase [Novipirellula maiorica]|uniref:5-(carboxyamino)imidazole ribonucleotide synthase n=1 Tax=Novipirellula maiorica TaxID=1265734 RepID=UPI0021BC032B|nr:5-(carboxyamino)imidazole ribonucleotide synthase [Rhodopirellula maiorica]